MGNFVLCAALMDENGMYRWGTTTLAFKLHACGKSLRFYPPQLPPLEATALTSAAFSSDFDLDTSTLRYLLK